jgi:serine/threonine protein kinase
VGPGAGAAKAAAVPEVVVPAFSGRSCGASTTGGVVGVSGGASGSGSVPSPPATLAGARSGSPAAAAAGGGEDVPFSELDLTRPIGEGAFGRVYLAVWRETAVAVKLLAPRPADESWGGGGGAGPGGGPSPAPVGGTLTRCAHSPSTTSPSAAADAGAAALLAAVRREAALMAGLRHPHVVQYLGTVSTPPAVLSEYCPNGSVADLLARAAAAAAAAAASPDAGASTLLPWGRRLGFALGAAKGMLHLHAQAPPLLHRDLKPANLLVDAAWRAKVADFNLAWAADVGGGGGSAVGAGPGEARSSLAAAANPRWVAPEVLAGAPASPAADVFSFGVVLWELLTWSLPWADLGPWQVVLAVVERRARLPLPAVMQGADPASPSPPPSPSSPPSPSPTLADADLPPGGLPAAAAAYGALVRACWADDPAARPDFGSVIAALRPIVAAQAAANGRRRGRGGSPARAAGAA